MCRVPLLVGLLAVSTAACATEGVYRPTRFDVGASATAIEVDYPRVYRLDDHTIIVSTDETETMSAEGVNLYATTHLATLGEGRLRRWSKVPLDLGMDWSVLWVPRIRRPESEAPTLRSWVFTPLMTLRFPARNPTQIYLAAGGGAAWHRDGSRDERTTTTAGVASVTVGLRHLVTPRAGLRLDLGLTSGNEPGWDHRNSRTWFVMSAGGFVTFKEIRR